MEINSPHGHHKLIKPSILFVVFGLAIYTLFPKETKFQYEYSKGKPWAHAKLIAPFSFPIGKSEAQMDSEKHQITSNHPNYFNKNSNLDKENFRILQKKYLNLLDSTETVFLDSLLKSVYSRAIIDPVWFDKIEQSEVVVVSDRESQPVSIQMILTPKKAYVEAQESIQSYQKDCAKTGRSCNLNKVDIEGFIVSNLTPNEKLTQELLQQKLDQISKTKGMVQKGELIVSTGQIVGENEFELINSYKHEFTARFSGSGSWHTYAGSLLIVGSPLALLFLFLFLYRKKVLLSSKKTSFLLISILVFVGLVMLNNKLDSLDIYMIPIVILPILVRSFFDTRLASFVLLISLLLMAYIVPNSFEFIYIQIITGTVAVFTLVNITKRSHIFRTAVIVFVTYVISYYGMLLTQEVDIHKIDWTYVAIFGGNSIMLTLSYPLVFLIEKLFGFTSDVTLLELSDTNQPLLKKLSEKAPGTFQHSLQVANIAEEIVKQIGGNPLLVRTGALYHDIGKMVNPAYFTENQSGHFNPHDSIDSIESARIIIQHIPDGIAMGRKYNLPQSIIDFIPTHQGTLTAKYFLLKYRKQTLNNPIETSLFSYPGPKPFSKETVAVMIADSVEAASRSLKEYTEDSIRGLVHKIVDYQLSEKQYENVNMTFKDLNLIKKVLVEKLLTIYHARVAYPEEATRH